MYWFKLFHSIHSSLILIRLTCHIYILIIFFWYFLIIYRTFERSKKHLKLSLQYDKNKLNWVTLLVKILTITDFFIIKTIWKLKKIILFHFRKERNIWYLLLIVSSLPFSYFDSQLFEFILIDTYNWDILIRVGRIDLTLIQIVICYLTTKILITISCMAVYKPRQSL